MTICMQCKHLYKVRESDPWYRWLCMKHPRLQGLNAVTGDDTLQSPPYLFCRDVNGGACPLYEEDAHADEPSLSN